MFRTSAKTMLRFALHRLALVQLTLLLEPERNDLTGAVESQRWFAQPN
ncbi:hypothetical protein [Micromonospora rubida]